MPTTTLRSLVLQQLSDNATRAKTISDQKYSEVLPYSLHQGCLKALKFFLDLHPAPSFDDQTPAERELMQKIEHQLTYYLGEG